MIRTMKQADLRYIIHHANQGDIVIVILTNGDGYEVGAVSLTSHSLSYETVEPGPLETLEEAEKVAAEVEQQTPDPE